MTPLNSHLLTLFHRGATGQPGPPTASWALWLFNEGSGQTAYDSSGNGRHLWLGSSGAVGTDDPAWATIAGVQCLEFAGAQRVVFQSAVHTLAQPFTVHALVYRPTRSDGGVFFCPSGSSFWSLAYDTEFLYANLGVGFQGPSDATAGVWHFCTLVANGASTRQRVDLLPSAVGNAGTNGIGTDMRLGERNYTPPMPYIGAIAAMAIRAGAGTESDDVAWYNYLRAVKGVA